MKHDNTRPFALHGSEKMIYDIRMGPQAVEHKGKIYTVYQANEHDRPAHPYITVYDRDSGIWSTPIKIGDAKHWDHHFVPILWFDQDDFIHVLFNCHSNDGGTHLISQKPCDISSWREGPEIAPSITYPKVIPMANNKLVLYYRAFGHMGYWTYRVSGDGGYSWSEENKIVDFDQVPETDADTWAGTYHSVYPGKDGSSLHISFVYWDERKAVNPLYKRNFRSINRYHLYYLKLNIASGELATIEGTRMRDLPVNRKAAELCKVWDTGFQLTNMPSICTDERDKPYFIVPVSEDTPWQCGFYFISRVEGEWKRTRITDTNHTWAGNRILRNEDGTFKAYLVVNNDDGEKLSYGGGGIEEWLSDSNGENWVKTRVLMPEKGLLYNNPQFVEYSQGGELDGHLLFYGWEGPGSLASDGWHHNEVNLQHRGKAFLWMDNQ